MQNGTWSVTPSIITQDTYTATFIPPVESLWNGGIFYANIKLSTHYPLIQMTTKIYHPNFSQKPEYFGHNGHIEDIVEYMYKLFINPDMNPSVQYNSDASKMFYKDPQNFSRIAKEWTRTYAI